MPVNHSKSLRLTDNMAIKIRFSDRETARRQYLSMWNNSELTCVMFRIEPRTFWYSVQGLLSAQQPPLWNVKESSVLMMCSLQCARDRRVESMQEIIIKITKQSLWFKWKTNTLSVHVCWHKHKCICHRDRQLVPTTAAGIILRIP